MALSVHELRDFAPGHGKPAQGVLASFFHDKPKLRLWGRALLRITFALIAAFSLTFVIGAIVSSAISTSDKPLSSGDFVYDGRGKSRQKANGGGVGGATAWLPSWFDGWFESRPDGRRGPATPAQSGEFGSRGLEISLAGGEIGRAHV